MGFVYILGEEDCGGESHSCFPQAKELHTDTQAQVCANSVLLSADVILAGYQMLYRCYSMLLAQHSIESLQKRKSSKQGKPACKSKPAPALPIFLH